MKAPPNVRDARNTTIGNRELSAWATSENTCRIQSRHPAISAELKRMANRLDMERVGYSVVGGHLQIFSIPRTLSWVNREIVQNLLQKFHPIIS